MRQINLSWSQRMKVVQAKQKGLMSKWGGCVYQQGLSVLVRTTGTNDLTAVVVVGSCCPSCSDPHLLCRFPALTKSEPVSCVALSTCKAEPASLLHCSCSSCTVELHCWAAQPARGNFTAFSAAAFISLSWQRIAAAMKWIRPGNQSNQGLPSALASWYRFIQRPSGWLTEFWTRQAWFLTLEMEDLCCNIINLFMSFHLSCSRLNQKLTVVAGVGNVIMAPLDASTQQCPLSQARTMQGEAGLNPAPWHLIGQEMERVQKVASCEPRGNEWKIHRDNVRLQNRNPQSTQTASNVQCKGQPRKL